MGKIVDGQVLNRYNNGCNDIDDLVFGHFPAKAYEYEQNNTIKWKSHYLHLDRLSYPIR